MRIIESDFDGLVESFGATRRLSARIGALARKGLFISEGVLEVALDSDGGPLKTFLLSKELLDSADAPSGLNLPDDPVELAVVGRDNGSVLCLADEVGEDEPSTTSSETGLASPDGGRGIITSEDARKSLTDDNVRELKMELVTSNDPSTRIEALRKLYLSSLDNDTKAKMLLVSLADRDGDVRAEAAKALAGLGLDAGLSENLAKASTSDVAQRVVSVSNISSLFERLDDQQRVIALSALAAFLSPNEPPEMVESVLGLFVTHGESVDESMLSVVLKNLVDLLQVKLSTYDDGARRLLTALYPHHTETISQYLVSRMTEVGQESLRFYLLGILTRNDLKAARDPATLELLIDGLLSGSEMDKSYQSCVSAIVELGEHATDALIDRMQTTRVESKQRRVIEMLGHLLRRDDPALSDAASQRIVHACCETYLASKTEIRVVLLETGFCSHPNIADDDQSNVLRAFIDDLHEFRFDRQLELLEAALISIGGVSVEPMFDSIIDSSHDDVRTRSARLLPEVASNVTDFDGSRLLSITKAFREMLDEEESDFPDRGPLFVALGRIGAHPSLSADDARDLAAYLLDALGKSSASYDVLEALGYIASGANLDASIRIEVGHRLLNVLTKGLPQMSSRMRKNEEGEEVLHFGRETTAYTDMIPRILEGLQRMVESPDTPDALRQRMFDELTGIWRRVTEFKLVWAPAAVMALSRVLGEIALSDHSDEQQTDEIAELLSRRLILLPVLQVLSRMSMARASGTRMDKLSLKVVEELTSRLQQDPAPEYAERRQILETIAAMAGRERIGEKDRESDHARQRVVEALFAELKNKSLQARSLLEGLIKNPRVPEKIRNEIDRRLKPLRQRG